MTFPPRERQFRTANNLKSALDNNLADLAIALQLEQAAQILIVDADCTLDGDAFVDGLYFFVCLFGF